VILGYVKELKDAQTFNKVSPKLGITYHFSPAAMVYASYSEGFKSGGWNADFDTNSQIAAGIRVRPESAHSGEVGLKSQFWGGRARLNVVGFYERIDDFQVFQLTLRTVGSQTVQQTSLTNAGLVTSKGVEVEGVLKPIPGLTLSANATYDDSRYDRFPGGGGSFGGQILSANGAQTPYAPAFKGYFAADVDQPLNGVLDLFAHLGVATQTHSNSDAKYLNPTVGYIYKIDGYTIADARLGVRSEKGGWRASIWARNLFDKTYAYASFGPTVGSFREAKYGDPRTYGVTLAVEY
jgi:iron complex outermembrane receptor protein